MVVCVFCIKKHTPHDFLPKIELLFKVAIYSRLFLSWAIVRSVLGRSYPTRYPGLAVSPFVAPEPLQRSRDGMGDGSTTSLGERWVGAGMNHPRRRENTSRIFIFTIYFQVPVSSAKDRVGLGCLSLLHTPSQGDNSRPVSQPPTELISRHRLTGGQGLTDRQSLTMRKLSRVVSTIQREVTILCEVRRFA